MNNCLTIEFVCFKLVDTVLELIKTKSEFADIEVVGVYSEEAEAAEKLHEKYGVPIMAHYADAVGKIDGLMVTARKGDNHYPYAKPYIASGIPMFIDNPITAKEEDAVAFMKELKAAGVRVCGGSSLKGDSVVRRLKAEREANEGGKTLSGYVRAPYQKENQYGGFSFYAPHLTEMVCEIFGRHPLSVTTRENGDNLHVLFHDEEYDCVGLFCDGNYRYYASRMAETTMASEEIAPTVNDWYMVEFTEFYRLLCGGAQEVSFRDFISSVFIMNAIERSLHSGKEESVITPEI